MRDLILTLILLALMPVCYRKPFVGLAVFSWLAYMRVQDLTWGFAKEQRWSFLIAGITLAGYLFQSRRRFIQLIGGGAVFASTTPLAGCVDGMPDVAVGAWFDRGDPSDLRRDMLAHAASKAGNPT